MMTSKQQFRKYKSVKCKKCLNLIRTYCKEHGFCVNCCKECCKYCSLKDDKDDNFSVGEILETPDGKGKLISRSIASKTYGGRRKILVFKIIETNKIKRYTRTKIIPLNK